MHLRLAELHLETLAELTLTICNKLNFVDLIKVSSREDLNSLYSIPVEPSIILCRTLEFSVQDNLAVSISGHTSTAYNVG